MSDPMAVAVLANLPTRDSIADIRVDRKSNIGNSQIIISMQIEIVSLACFAASGIEVGFE